MDFKFQEYLDKVLPQKIIESRKNKIFFSINLFNIFSEGFC